MGVLTGGTSQCEVYKRAPPVVFRCTVTAKPDISLNNGGRPSEHAGAMRSGSEHRRDMKQGGQDRKTSMIPTKPPAPNPSLSTKVIEAKNKDAAVKPCGCFRGTAGTIYATQHQYTNYAVASCDLTMRDRRWLAVAVAFPASGAVPSASCAVAMTPLAVECGILMLRWGSLHLHWARRRAAHATAGSIASEGQGSEPPAITKSG